MRNKVFLILIGYLALVLSCQPDCGPFANRYKTTEVKWQNLNYEGEELTPETDSVSYANFSIQARFETEVYFAQKTGLIGAAYACDPALPTTDETIESLIITANKDFSSSLPSGENLSALFDIVVTELEGPQEKQDLKTYLAGNPTVPMNIVLILKEKPETADSYSFAVAYQQSNFKSNYSTESKFLY